MEVLNEILSSVLIPILCTILTAIAGYIGIRLKNRIEKQDIEKEKKEIVTICVKATEQLFKDLTGTEKYKKCVEAVSEMLASKGIEISEFEIQMLVESTLAEFNKAFDKKEDDFNFTCSGMTFSDLDYADLSGGDGDD